MFPKTKWANYEEAEAACKELGGHILRISSKKEYEYFVNYRAKETPLKLWIILEKFDLTGKDKSSEQTKYMIDSPDGTQYASSTENRPFITNYQNSHVIYLAPNDGVFSNELFAICEWEK